MDFLLSLSSKKWAWQALTHLLMVGTQLFVIWRLEHQDSCNILHLLDPWAGHILLREHYIAISNDISFAGYFVPDAIVAAVVGLVTGWCVGPCLPVVGKWLAKPSIIQVLLHGSVLALALSSQFFPYSKDAPKRVVFQHTIQTIGTVGSTMFLINLIHIYHFCPLAGMSWSCC